MTGILGGLETIMDPFLDLSTDPIQNNVDFGGKSKIQLLSSYDCGMTLVTWHGTKYWINLSPYNQIFTMKSFLPYFLIFLLDISGA